MRTLLRGGLFLCLFTVGCASNSTTTTATETKNDKLPEEEISVSVGRAGVYRVPQQFKEGIGLRAHIEGQTLVVSARNERTEEVTFYAQDFAFIVSPDRERGVIRISPGTAIVARAMPLFLQSGDQGTLEIPLRIVPPPSGTRLVYNNKRQSIQFFIALD